MGQGGAEVDRTAAVAQDAKKLAAEVLVRNKNVNCFN